MGNRAVIVADDVTNKNKKERCGIYLHFVVKKEVLLYSNI